MAVVRDWSGHTWRILISAALTCNAGSCVCAWGNEPSTTNSVLVTCTGGKLGEGGGGDECTCIGFILYYYIYLCVDDTTLLSSHRGCSKDKIWPTLVLRPSTILSLLLFRQF